MPSRYHAESWLPRPNLNVVKIFEYGDNIENRMDGQSLLADQSWYWFFRHWTPKNQAHPFMS
jgi:hypothetical protein